MIRILSVALLISCTQSDPDTGPAAQPTFSITWGEDTLALAIEDGMGNYQFGLTETASSSPVPWTGEDGVYGYYTAGGQQLLYCHESGDCWVGGLDPAYYDALGCEETTF